MASNLSIFPKINRSRFFKSNQYHVNSVIYLPCFPKDYLEKKN